MTEYKKAEAQLQKQSYKWLVTGAAGFIGSHLSQRLLELNQEVIGLDNMSCGRPENLTAIEASSVGSKGSWQFVQGDIRDCSIVHTACQETDFILHQAALASVPQSIDNPLAFHTSNVDGFFMILEAARTHKITKLVYASSSSVYGDEPTLPKTEVMMGGLISPYAATKKIDEVYASVYSNCYGTPAVGLRYFNVFGARQDPMGAYAAVIPIWIRSLMDGLPVYINGDGSFSRDFCYIENVIQANILAALSQTNTNGKVYNIALGERTSLTQLYHYICEELRTLIPDATLPPPTHREQRVGDIPHSYANIDLAKGDLGFAPTVSVKVGLSETIKSHSLPNVVCFR